ncbi:putative lipopolysaccharide biosynthesis protein [Pseudomonas tohonis]|uniref:Lipopolysaccharide biosynthesis protein n=1 Tax=Pseudomonas tohonis TaxID=2725477 RepID=A0A6J4ED64_9PSED|nr:O-antigen ligase family protein [Pseudomonas tohonis]BCG27358.1 putative lipopolysaccharide biosynthesis protein [Pseudomonas tohonis]GJN52863.1 putative lipopolysaccharide biosynthesis protein [Pseudomonas tohonis]
MSDEKQPCNLATPYSRFEKAAEWLTINILPVGLFVLLTGMFWVWDRALYHKAYYLFLAAPTLLVLLMQPKWIRHLFSSPLLIAFAAFSIYTLITLNWTSSEDSGSSLAKRPLYVLFLFFATGLLAHAAPDRIMKSMRYSAWLASLAGAMTLAFHLYSGASDRLTGYGALYNPLLSSHVYGFFLVIWGALWFSKKQILDIPSIGSLAILGALIIATGSRTPLLAIASAIIWLALTQWNRRSLVVLATLGLAGTALLLLFPEALTNRGLSYRPEIWQRAWALIMEKPLLGHGYDAPLAIPVPGVTLVMADPHNMLLAVAYYCGFIGVALWLALYLTALVAALRNRQEPLSCIASTLLVFGFVASMTEGGAFLSRPKEHWFLIWIPMALIMAAEVIAQKKQRQSHSQPK